MYVRVVRFTDVDADRVEGMLGDVEGSGPPPGVTAHRLQMMLDKDQGTVVVVQYFETEEDMRNSEAALDAMDPSDTPGTRTSIDRGELKLDVQT
jgi:hypothetical protein